MVVAEAAALLCIGLFCGISTTMFDVLMCGAASFMSHFSLWVLLNALLAVHVQSRTKAIWWAVPFNLGYIEAYFLTTVASYESFSKSLIVPLSLVSVISPLLTYGLWTAKKEKNAFGQALSLLIVVATLVASFFINGELTVYAVVVSLLLAFVLLRMPVHRLKISPGKREIVAIPEEVPEAAAVREGRHRDAQKQRGRASRETTRHASRRAASEQVDKPTRRTPLRSRREERSREEVERERRRVTATRRRAEEPVNNDAPPSHNGGMTTLGTARTARRATRNNARYDQRYE